jgi:hypothetical protein
MPARSDLVLRCFTDPLHGNIKSQAYSGKGMVAVQGNGIITDPCHYHYQVPAFCPHPELHSDLYFMRLLEFRFRHFVHERLVPGPISLVRFDDNGKLVPGTFAFQFLFKARNDLPGTMDIIEGLPAIGRVQDLTIFILESIVYGHNTVFTNLHLFLLSAYLCLKNAIRK